MLVILTIDVNYLLDSPNEPETYNVPYVKALWQP